MIAGLPVASAPNRSLSWEGIKPEATWVDSEISYITRSCLEGHRPRYRNYELLCGFASKSQHS